MVDAARSAWWGPISISDPALAHLWDARATPQYAEDFGKSAPPRVLGPPIKQLLSRQFPAAATFMQDVSYQISRDLRGMLWRDREQRKVLFQPRDQRMT